MAIRLPRSEGSIRLLQAAGSCRVLVSNTATVNVLSIIFKRDNFLPLLFYTFLSLHCLCYVVIVSIKKCVRTHISFNKYDVIVSASLFSTTVYENLVTSDAFPTAEGPVVILGKTYNLPSGKIWYNWL